MRCSRVSIQVHFLHWPLTFPSSESFLKDRAKDSFWTYGGGRKIQVHSTMLTNNKRMVEKCVFFLHMHRDSGLDATCILAIFFPSCFACSGFRLLSEALSNAEKMPCDPVPLICGKIREGKKIARSKASQWHSSSCMTYIKNPKRDAKAWQALRLLLKDKLRHLRHFKGLFEQTLIWVRQHQTISGLNTPPSGAQGETFREKAGAPQGNDGRLCFKA